MTYPSSLSAALRTGGRTDAQHQQGLKATVTASLGTFVEYYDFAVYAFMAATIAPLFFPTSNAVVALILTYGAFGSSYLVRPLGAMIFGPLGDKYGRRGVLAFIILLMSATTAVIGVLPTYAQAGVFAPALLTLLRLIQGISVGGEFGGAASYVAEFAPPGHRARRLSWLIVAIGFGLLVGAFVAALLNVTLSPANLLSWGWRIPFLVALPVGVIGVYLRLKLADSPEFERLEEENKVEASPLKRSLRTEYRGILLTISLLSVVTVSTYLYLIYAPSYLAGVVLMKPTTALACSTVAIICFCVACPIFASLADRFGRRPMLGIGAFLVGAGSYPAFLIMSQGHAVNAAIAMSLLAILTAWCNVTALPMLIELFATSTRFTSFGIGWNITAALFGGLAPLIATSLVASTGNNAAPAFYAIPCAILTVGSVFFVRETADVDLRTAEPGGTPADVGTAVPAPNL
jgi:MHS family proline/betaine transporter-like MFS transporter